MLPMPQKKTRSEARVGKGHAGFGIEKITRCCSTRQPNGKTQEYKPHTESRPIFAANLAAE